MEWVNTYKLYDYSLLYTSVEISKPLTVVYD